MQIVLHLLIMKSKLMLELKVPACFYPHSYSVFKLLIDLCWTYSLFFLINHSPVACIIPCNYILLCNGDSSGTWLIITYVIFKIIFLKFFINPKECRYIFYEYFLWLLNLSNFIYIAMIVPYCNPFNHSCYFITNSLWYIECMVLNPIKLLRYYVVHLNIFKSGIISANI